ncbi:MAG: hypothetical protein BAJALOKI2v1_260013 [Promethearchaeota archaeon]|nr:MAG: hypothetical protein BAJALOKI2v1_260013 [Candidatus Lokiarchaeota archaeon]
MKSSKNIDENLKSKKEIQKELEVYESFVKKKLISKDFNSAMEKICSALTLIQEYSDQYKLEGELKTFRNIRSELEEKLVEYRSKYKLKFENLIKEELDQDNLESLVKLLAILKEDIEEHINKYKLHELNDKINHYFSCIKNLYAILSSLQASNYEYISKTLKGLKTEVFKNNFDNLLPLILRIQRKMLLGKLRNLAKEFDTLSIAELSKKLNIKEEETIEHISEIMKDPNSPIRLLNYTNKEVLFNSPKIFDV